MKRNNVPISPDKRGKHEPATKIPETTIQEVKAFLDSLPKYYSHYSTTPRKFFHPQLNQQKIFNYYKEKHRQSKLSIFKFAQIFKSYNVSFYIPKKDTCNKCDEFKIKLKSHISVSEIHSLEAARLQHHNDAEHARQQLRDAVELTKVSENTLCITFDLQKVLPIPYLTTNVAYYKRQLNFYNFGINDRETNKGYMHTWTEVEGKRGSNEVLSCLFNFLNNRDLSGIEHVYSFSDNCGGQNRNKNIINFLSFICKKFKIKTWHHIYLESGHSYLPNDTDFGKIEKKKNQRSFIFSQDQWNELIRSCKFHQISMKGKFFDFSSKFKSICKTTENKKFSFLQLKEFIVNGSNNFMSFKSSHDPEAQFEFVNLPDVNSSLQFDALYCPNGIKLSKQKYDDLLFLARFLPDDNKPELISLPHENCEGSDYEEYPDN